MHPFQENIQAWLSRKVPDYAQNNCLDIPIVLSSDIGLERKENQDRAAALYTGKKSINPLFVMAVADGMGGMRDGGKCSTLALSSFLHSLIQHRNLEIQERACEAIKSSNRQVFESYRGSGGSTLTAILLDSAGKKIIVHLGDTRVYTFGPGKKMERHTRDDSMVEAVGGSGRELLQFVGMGDSMQPKISALPCLDGFCAITTDGIHCIDEKTLGRVLENSANIKEASERINSVSMWCGGRDNATSIIFDMGEITQSIAQYQGSGIRLWDADGDLTTLWLREEDQAFNAKHPKTRSHPDMAEHRIPPPSPPSNPSGIDGAPKKTNVPTKRLRKKKGKNQSKEIQLNIEIGNSGEQGEVGADSKPV